MSREASGPFISLDHYLENLYYYRTFNVWSAGMSKLTVEFNDKSSGVIQTLARENDTNQSEILRRAVKLLEFISQERKQGSKFLIQSLSGEMREIVGL